MTEKTVQGEARHRGSEEYVEVTVIFHAKSVTFRIRKGATKKELWEAIKKKAEEEGIDLGDISSWTITIDSQLVLVDEVAGTIKSVDELTGAEEEIQDETVESNVVVALTQNVEGGNLPSISSNS